MTTLLDHPGLASNSGDLPPLENGDRLDQRTFHARYGAMPPETRAELIGGLVYMSSPVRKDHGRPSGKALVWLDAYETETPGVEAFDNTTAILGEDSEVQPDCCLLINPAFGGQTTELDGFVIGAPELVVEVAASTESRDLHIKLQDYERAGVIEYVVVLPRRSEVRWFVNRQGTLTRVHPDPDGLHRSAVFPGLWLDPEALLRGDSAAVRAVVEQGLATPEHAEFVGRLAAARSQEM